MFKNTEKNYKKKLNLKIKGLNFNYNFKINSNNDYKMYIYMLNNWNFIIYNLNEKFYLYFYSKNMFIFTIINFKKLNLIFDNKTNSISINFKYKNTFYSLYWNFFKNIFYSFFFFFFKKLKFKGKGYYIFKTKRNTVALRFGYSHKVYIYSYFILIKFISKTVVFLFGINKKDIIFKSFELKNKRSYNIFTGKGLRFSKQIIYKKIGKVSSYR